MDFIRGHVRPGPSENQARKAVTKEYRKSLELLLASEPMTLHVRGHPFILPKIKSERFTF